MTIFQVNKTQSSKEWRIINHNIRLIYLREKGSVAMKRFENINSLVRKLKKDEKNQIRNIIIVDKFMIGQLNHQLRE